MRSHTYYILALLVWVCLMLGCSNPGQVIPKDTASSGSINISADESFKPVIEEQRKVFEGSYPLAKLNITYKPEADCLKDLFSDSATRMVIVTRSLTKKEERYFKDSLSFIPVWNKIASDAICVIVNQKSSDTLFTKASLTQQLTGMLNNGKTVVFDGLNATSSVRFAIDSLLKGKQFDSRVVKAVKNSQEVIDYVADNENAIGFVGITWIGNPEDKEQVAMLEKVKMGYIKCDVCQDTPYIKPSQGGIVTKRYPLVRGLFYILKENYDGLGGGFTKFMLYERGQLIFRRAYLKPGKMDFEVRNVKINEKLKKD